MTEEKREQKTPEQEFSYRKQAEGLGETAKEILEELSGDEASFSVYSVRGGRPDQDFDIRISGGARGGKQYDFRIETVGASYRLINMKGEQGFETTLIENTTFSDLKDKLKRSLEPLVEKKEIRHY